MSNKQTELELTAVKSELTLVKGMLLAMTDRKHELALVVSRLSAPPQAREETAAQVEVRKLGEAVRLLHGVINDSESGSMQTMLYPAYGTMNRVWQQLVDGQEV